MNCYPPQRRYDQTGGRPARSRRGDQELAGRKNQDRRRASFAVWLIVNEAGTKIARVPEYGAGLTPRTNAAHCGKACPATSARPRPAWRRGSPTESGDPPTAKNTTGAVSSRGEE